MSSTTASLRQTCCTLQASALQVCRKEWPALSEARVEDPSPVLGLSDGCVLAMLTSETGGKLPMSEEVLRNSVHGLLLPWAAHRGHGAH